MADSIKPESLKLVVFMGSARPGRVGGRVLTYVTKLLSQRGHQVTVADPMEIKLPILEKPHFFYRGEDKPPEELDKLATQIYAADGYVVVSCEYNHSIPPGLTNLMSHFGGSKYAFRPCAIVTYSSGQFGGMRAAMQLRCFLAELGCLTTSNLLAFPEVTKILHENGEFTSPQEKDNWDRRADRCFAQLEYVAYAIKDRRKTTNFPQ